MILNWWLRPSQFICVFLILFPLLGRLCLSTFVGLRKRIASHFAIKYRENHLRASLCCTDSFAFQAGGHLSSPNFRRLMSSFCRPGFFDYSGFSIWLLAVWYTRCAPFHVYFNANFYSIFCLPFLFSLWIDILFKNPMCVLHRFFFYFLWFTQSTRHVRTSFPFCFNLFLFPFPDLISLSASLDFLTFFRSHALGATGGWFSSIHPSICSSVRLFIHPTHTNPTYLHHRVVFFPNIRSLFVVEVFVYLLQFFVKTVPLLPPCLRSNLHRTGSLPVLFFEHEALLFFYPRCRLQRMPKSSGESVWPYFSQLAYTLMSVFIHTAFCLYFEKSFPFCFLSLSTSSSSCSECSLLLWCFSSFWSRLAWLWSTLLCPPEKNSFASWLRPPTQGNGWGLFCMFL